MSPKIAACIFVLGILGLFFLDRDRKTRTSRALWLPVVWIFIAGSRPVSFWLQMAPQESYSPYVDGSPLDRAAWTAMVAVGLAVLVSRGRQVGSFLRANWAILWFFFYCVISILWSDFPEVAFKRWIKALGDLVMVLIVLTDLDPIAAIKRLLARIAFLLVPLSILLIKYFPELGRTFAAWSWTPVYVGATTNKNALGMVALMLGLGSLWRFLQALRAEESDERTGPLIAHGIVLAMVAWTFVTAGSMTSLACFIMTASLMVATSLSVFARKTGVVHFLVITVLCVSFSALFLNMGASLLTDMGRDPTLTGRTEIWNQVLALATNPLLGTGFESFWLGDRLQRIWSIWWWHPNEAHNGYIEVYLNLGWIGVGLLSMVIVTGYRDVVTALRRDPQVGSLRLAYLVTAVVYNFTEAAFKEINLVWIFFLLAVAAVPKVLAPPIDPPLGIEDPDGFFEPDLAANHVVVAGLTEDA